MGSNYSIHECFILAHFFWGGGESADRKIPERDIQVTANAAVKFTSSSNFLNTLNKSVDFTQLFITRIKKTTDNRKEVSYKHAHFHCWERVKIVLRCPVHKGFGKFASATL